MLERPTIHVVKKGENFSNVAKKYSVTVQELQEINKLQDINFIKIGMRLKIPKEINIIKTQQKIKSLKNEVVNKNVVENKIAQRVNKDIESSNIASQKGIQNVLDADIRRFLPKNFPQKKIITGNMILRSSQKYSVDPFLIAAILRNDSSYGTSGKGATNNNPGNVGQFDSLDRLGVTVSGYSTLQAGIDAAAQNLAKRIRAYKKTFNTHRTPTVREILEGKALVGEDIGKRFWGRYMTLPNGPSKVIDIHLSLEKTFERNGI